jgi:hypothetical protein
VASSDVEAYLAESPVTAEILVLLGVLSQEGETYRLAYSVLTVRDQELIFEVSRSLGRDLASQFQAHKAEFDRMLERYPRPELRDELGFGLVAGLVLNWEGLKQATELGLRIDPEKLPGGRPFLLHSEEIGAEVSSEGFYWASHTFPGPRVSFSTFGDSASIPRRKGMPDVLAAPVEEGLALLNEEPDIRGAAQQLLVLQLIEVLADSGTVMEALAGSRLTEAELAERTKIPPVRLSAILGLLSATEYVSLVDGRFDFSVPLLTERDKGVVEEVVGLGTELVSEWLRANRVQFQAKLKGLTPLRNGLPFELVFNEIWHYTFGWTTRFLAEQGFYQNPRAAGHIYRGYVPLVWASSLYSESE